VLTKYQVIQEVMKYQVLTLTLTITITIIVIVILTITITVIVIVILTISIILIVIEHHNLCEFLHIYSLIPINPIL